MQSLNNKRTNHNRQMQAESSSRRNSKRRRRRASQIKLLLKFVCILCTGMVIGAAIPVVMAISRGDFYSTPVLSEETIAEEVLAADQKTEDNKEELSKEDIDEKLEPLPEVDEEYLVLVNKDNRIPEDYEIALKALEKGGRYVDARIADKVQAFTDAAADAGMDVQVISGYRSEAKQQQLVDEDVDRYMNQGMDWQEAYEETMKYTMPAGYSEHQTGLAVDIVACGYQVLDDSQALREENKWLREHCAEYGFILRYPKGKEDITGIYYENWHFRYVGVDVAKYITENDLTFEEFMELYN